MKRLFLLVALAETVLGFTLADIQNDLRGLQATLLANLTNSADDTFKAAITASGPKTFFIPTDAALQNNTLSSAQVASLLLYHLIPNQLRTNDTLGTVANHSILTTALTGHSLTFLEGGEPAVLACGVPSERLGTGQIEIYNQGAPTFSTQSHVNTDHNIVYHVINRIIDFPTNYPALMTLYQDWHQFARTAGISDDEVGAWTGFTLFVVKDQTFTNAQSVIANSPALSLFNNHLIKGKSVWYDTFLTDTYHNELGKELKFTVADPDTQEFMVTVGNSSGRISFSDRLLANGVIHEIESVLSDISPPSTTTSTTSVGSTKTSSPPDNQTSSNSLSGGAIAGIVVGVLALLIIAAVILFFLWRRRRERQDQQAYATAQKFPYSAGTSSWGGGPPPPSPFGIQSSDRDSTFLPATASTREFTPVRRGKGAPVPASLPLTPFSQTSPSTVAGSSDSNGQLPDEVVENLLTRLAARIDRPNGQGDGEEPPSYRTP